MAGDDVSSLTWLLSELLPPPSELQLRLKFRHTTLVPAHWESTELQHREARGNTLRNRPQDLERTLVSVESMGPGEAEDTR